MGVSGFILNDTFNLFVDDITIIPDNSSSRNTKAQSILIAQSAIASVGIVANLTVIVVFLNHKKLRKKIPNIFIINQVRKSTNDCSLSYFRDWPTWEEGQNVTCYDISRNWRC